MEKPKLVISDIDGVWTDGGMYYDQTGNEWKKFNTSDSAGVLFLRILDIPFAILSGEDTAIVKRRAKKLNTELVFLGIKNKLETATELCKKLGIDLKEVAFIGDDLNDLGLFAHVGFSAAPANAPDYIKSRVDYVTKLKGGEGAFREFVEHLVGQHSSMDFVLSKYLESE
ncbi:MAG TPA: HAD-IIIA family hydrolase [Flavobacteriaceae bacterium]|nr:HAD-IIIA family hydrolase [Flavobacteriaceae bacterium]